METAVIALIWVFIAIVVVAWFVGIAVLLWLFRALMRSGITEAARRLGRLGRRS
jgi:hypothetical protein